MKNTKKGSSAATDDSTKTSSKTSSKDSQMRTAWIRVSKINHTGKDKSVLDEYSAERIKNILDEWAWSSELTYWFAEHNTDEPNDHFHIAIQFATHSRYSTVHAKFPHSEIQPANNIKRCVQYLIHLNTPEKTQYSWDIVVTNCPDMTKYKALSRSQQELCLEKFLDKIDSGEITQINYSQLIPFKIRSRYKTLLDNAFQCKADEIILSGVNRPVEVIYIYGASGIGKTVLAKRLCYDHCIDEDPCISSSNNDPLQNYRGHKCLILDDFRDSAFTYTDLLKLTDPYTRCSIKSRYSNKYFLGDLIVITTTSSLNSLYSGVHTYNDLFEFRRRLSTYIEAVGDTFKIYSYNGIHNGLISFKNTSTIINPFYEWCNLTTKKTKEDLLQVPLTPIDSQNDLTDLIHTTNPPLKKDPIPGCEVIPFNGTRSSHPSLTQIKIS